MHANIPDLMDLFEGYQEAYGTYKITGKSDEKNKLIGKAYSLKGPVTVELWSDHVNGKQGLGIIPICKDSTVKFAAIDIDEYPLDLISLNKNIVDGGLPLVLCRTKSGGAHLYLFLKEHAPAEIIQRKMREFAAYLGYGASEIFPKQTRLIQERGDIGQWINMPYFVAPKTTRFALGRNHDTLDLPGFCKLAFELRTTKEQLDKINVRPTELLRGGPPCLQTLCKQGFPEGTRNNGLFNLGVYARKSCPDTWPNLLQELNQKYMDPPLNVSEVQGVIKSVSKKEFQYMCSQPPIKQHCNAPVCRSCEHGIGNNGAGMPRFGTLSKLLTDPPIWFLEVEGGGRLELTTEQLQHPLQFQNVCMSVLNIMPPITKRDEWQAIVQHLLAEVTVVEVPPEATPQGILKQHLEEFCTSRVQARSEEEILLGKPWTTNTKTYFRLKDFLSYLERQKFRALDLNYVAMYLRDGGAVKHFFNVRGKGINCYAVPSFDQQTESFNIPKQEGKVTY